MTARPASWGDKIRWSCRRSAPRYCDCGWSISRRSNWPGGPPPLGGDRDLPAGIVDEILLTLGDDGGQRRSGSGPCTCCGQAATSSPRPVMTARSQRRLGNGASTAQTGSRPPNDAAITTAPDGTTLCRRRIYRHRTARSDRAMILAESTHTHRRGRMPRSAAVLGEIRVVAEQRLATTRSPRPMPAIAKSAWRRGAARSRRPGSPGHEVPAGRSEGLECPDEPR